MLCPKRLQHGDIVAIVAPSGPVSAEELSEAREQIESRGYRVVIGEHVLEKHPHNGYLAGRDEERFADLKAFLRREDIAAIFCARGGYGALRLFPRFEGWVAPAKPKVFTGYSDITALHLVLNGTFGWTTFYGPNACSLSKLDFEAADTFWRMLEVPSAPWELPAQADRMRRLVGGVVEGRLAGGCLSLLAHACGSRFQPNFRGCIVLIEDVNEMVYRVDRYVTQLLNAGVLQEASGFIVGTVTGWEREEGEKSGNHLHAVWEELLAPLNKPTIIGFPFGHEPNPLTLPLGVYARLDANNKTVTLLEAAVE